MESPPPTSFDLERDWPALSARVRAKLAASNVPAALRDDLVQETGLRLIELKDKLDPTRSVSALAGAIAMNLLRDHLRRESRLDPIAGVDVPAEVEDLENEVIARDEWRRVCAAIQRLNPEQKAALLAEIGAAAPPPGRSATAVRMLRMRGRKQIHALLEEMSRLRGVVGMTFQDAYERVAVRLTRVMSSLRADDVGQAGGAAVVLLAASMLIAQPDAPPTPQARLEGSPRPSAAVGGGGAVAFASIASEHRAVVASLARAATRGAGRPRLDVRTQRVRQPIHRLDLGPVGHVEGKDDEVLGIVAKTAGRATAPTEDVASGRRRALSAPLRTAPRALRPIDELGGNAGRRRHRAP